jgi:hypothetical protein
MKLLMDGDDDANDSLSMAERESLYTSSCRGNEAVEILLRMSIHRESLAGRRLSLSRAHHTCAISQSIPNPMNETSHKQLSPRNHHSDSHHLHIRLSDDQLNPPSPKYLKTPIPIISLAPPPTKTPLSPSASQHGHSAPASPNAGDLQPAAQPA